MSRKAIPTEFYVEHAVVSDVGLSRSNNQDSLGVHLFDAQMRNSQPGHLFIVADGMGAHAAGEVASKLAVETIVEGFRRGVDKSPDQAVREAVAGANAEIFRQGQESDELRGMGTTVSVLVLLPRRAVVAHVGDSRIYRLRRDALQQLTFDHSLVWEICAAEKISETEVPDFVPRNIITRSVGPTADVEIDLEGFYHLHLGDTFLLCSDGLSGQLEDEEIGTILHCLEPADAAQTLVDLADLRGGPDNVSVIVVRVAGTRPARQPQAKRRDRQERTIRSIRLLGWPLLAALALGALGWAVGGAQTAAVAGIIAAIFAGTAMLVGFPSRGNGQSSNHGEPQRLGKGPYATCDCALNEQSADCMARAVSEIRDVAANRLWQVDWDRFATLWDEAQRARKTKRVDRAVTLYCQIINFLMQQLRANIEAAEEAEA